MGVRSGFSGNRAAAAAVAWLVSLSAPNALAVTGNIEEGHYALSPDCDVSVVSEGPNSVEIRVDQKTKHMFATFKLDLRGDEIIAGPNGCGYPDGADRWEGNRVTRYWSHCGSPFSSADGAGSFILDQRTGRVVAVDVSYTVPHWSLPPRFGGLHTGPIGRITTDRFSCAAPGLSNEASLSVKTADDLNRLGADVERARPRDHVDDEASRKTVETPAPATGAQRAPADEGLARPVTEKPAF